MLDASGLLFDKTKGNYIIKYEGMALYYDNHHLAKAGAKKVSEVFDPIFNSSITTLNNDIKKQKDND